MLNRTPSSVIDFEIPEHRWTTEVPDLSGLRRFGCIAYIHSDGGKLNPRAKKGVFTGYPEGVKGFRIWLLDEQRCIISCNVVFMEDQMFKNSKSSVDNSGIISTTVNSTNKHLSFDFVGTDGIQDQGGVLEEQSQESPVQSKVQ